MIPLSSLIALHGYLHFETASQVKVFGIVLVLAYLRRLLALQYCCVDMLRLSMPINLHLFNYLTGSSTRCCLWMESTRFQKANPVGWRFQLFSALID